MRSTQEDSIGFFDHMRSGCEHSSSFKSVNMQNKHGSSIWSHGCYQKRCIKNRLIRYIFYVMESRVSSNCTCNIHRLWLNAWKRSQLKRKHSGKDCQKATDLKVYPNQIPVLAKFYSIMLSFMTMKIGIFQVRFIMFPLVEFPKICWTVKLICALSSAFWLKKIHKTKFEIEEEKIKSQIAKNWTAFVTPIFFGF